MFSKIKNFIDKWFRQSKTSKKTRKYLIFLETINSNNSKIIKNNDIIIQNLEEIIEFKNTKIKMLQKELKNQIKIK